MNSLHNKIYLKKERKKLKKTQILIFSIILILVITIFLVSKIGKIINVKLMSYAEVESKKISKTIINYAVNDVVVNNLKKNNLFEIQKNNQGEIQMIDFDTANVNSLLNDINQNILNYFRMLEHGETDNLDFVKRVLPGNHKIEDGIIMEIPSGLVLGNSLFSNIGPKIPVKISMIGDLESNISTNINKYGINNAIINVNVEITAFERVILPMYTKETVVKSKIPISIKIIQGAIPNYYISGIDNNSKLNILPNSN